MKEIVKDLKILSTISEEVTSSQQVNTTVSEMLKVAEANRSRCAGLAAIQIGIPMCIILVKTNTQSDYKAYINPKILFMSGKKYKTEEGCLSLEDRREVIRDKEITLSYQDEELNNHIRRFKGFEAQIIQHEVDHCNGILI